MFLDAVLARNPRLVSTALSLHGEGAIPPNCFVVDMDTVAQNTVLLADAALRGGLSLYFTTKHLGFNPRVGELVSRAGIPKAVAIDYCEAAVLSKAHVPIGHLGHLTQLPLRMIRPALDLQPEVITVFGLAKARQISQAAVRADKEARLLLRVVSEKDSFHPGQEGGIWLSSLVREAAAILRLPNVRIVGVTSYPCLQVVDSDDALKPTQNFYTILRAAETLQEQLRIHIEQVNAPGNSCVSSVPLLSQMGATHGEPGHALTGTTYLHANMHEPEAPALVYVSEVSHVNGETAYVFGGATHRREMMLHALVGSSSERMTMMPVHAPDPAAIDYYIAVSVPRHSRVEVGDTAILAPRAQVFVSRSCVAVVEGIQEGSPVLQGLYDPWGSPTQSILGHI